MASMETIDELFSRTVRTWTPGPSVQDHTGEHLRALFEAQLQSRHLDFAARWLQSQGRGYYTIGSAGHESNAAIALATRVDDPALLHYRSGGFYAARALRAGTTDPVRDVLLSLTSAASDPMSGGRHKVFGHPGLHIVPQTSTIGSHLPRVVGLAYALGLARQVGHSTPWPDDAIVVGSFGDASANHSTATGALNAAAYLTRRGAPCPVLLVCEDNRIGISTRSPRDWPGAMLRGLPGIDYVRADGADPLALLAVAQDAVGRVRESRRPVVLHLDTVRFMGHAGSDAEIAYRSQAEIVADHAKDPLLATARALVDEGRRTPEQVLDDYEGMRARVMDEAQRVLDEPQLTDRAAVVAPLTLPTGSLTVPAPVDVRPQETLAQAINHTLGELMAAHPEILVFGEDVAAKGGVYGVTRGLRKRFGGQRVFDTLLDEQTILGVALGTALAGFVPVPEIQYLAYLHNAEDQLRGEAASLRFFSDGQYQNGMVVRVAGLAYQRGFGGHFHNDNSVAVLRDIPGLVLAVPSHPADAPGMLRTCVALAQQDGRVCVFLEPIALYHEREVGDATPAAVGLGEVGVHGEGADLLLVSFGNGVPMSRRAAVRLAGLGIATTVVDLRWLSPLPLDALVGQAEGFPAVLVVDETRASGGVSEGVVTGLLDRGYSGRLGRVASADSFVPLGPAASTVLLSEDDVVSAGVRLANLPS